MERNLDIMAAIQAEKEKDMARQDQQPLDAEGTMMAEHKRFTFDVIDIPTDPLR